jgi:hypothetical protein
MSIFKKIFGKQQEVSKTPDFKALGDGMTWKGESIEDVEILRELPQELFRVLSEVNGFILHEGALHVRGACSNPEWHSLRAAWQGPNSFHVLYPDVRKTDIPFAQDQVGDQFLLRDGAVFRLFAETGEIEPLCESLRKFFDRVRNDIETFLNAGLQHKLEPGQLLHAFPPFCFDNEGKDVSLAPIPAQQLISLHADLARQIRDVPDGGQIKIKVVD